MVLAEKVVRAEIAERARRLARIEEDMM